MSFNNNFGFNSIDKYQKLEKLGSGAYGEVYKGKDLESGENVAIKKSKLQLQNDGVPQSIIREVSLLKELSHPNIVKLNDVVQDNQTIYLIFEQLDMDLTQRIKLQFEQKQNFNELTIKKTIYEILKGLNAMHSKRMMHRDLKPQNILLSQDGQKVKIGDLGISRIYSLKNYPYSQGVVTPWYRAPELLFLIENYSYPVDIWSVGCIFAEMVLFRPIFNGDSEIDIINRVFSILGKPDENTWPGVSKIKNYDNLPNYPQQKVEQTFQNLKILNEDGLDLLNKMFAYDPKQRISAKQALKHPYFKEYQQKRINLFKQNQNQLQKENQSIIQNQIQQQQQQLQQKYYQEQQCQEQQQQCQEQQQFQQQQYQYQKTPILIPQQLNSYNQQNTMQPGNYNMNQQQFIQQRQMQYPLQQSWQQNELEQQCIQQQQLIYQYYSYQQQQQQQKLESQNQNINDQKQNQEHNNDQNKQQQNSNNQ